MFVNSESVATMMNTKLIEQVMNNLLKENKSVKDQGKTRFCMVKQGLLSEKSRKDEYFQEACCEFEGKMQRSVQVSQVKRFYPGEEQPTNDHSCQSLEDKPTGDVPKNSHQGQIICSEITNLILTSKKSDDIEYYQLAHGEEEEESSQNNKKGHRSPNLLRSDGKAMKKKKGSIAQPANHVYFIRKIKRYRVRNVQKEYFNNCQNLPHSESTWEPEEFEFEFEFFNGGSASEALVK